MNRKLMPIHFGKRQVVYEETDEIKSIYFIIKGKFIFIEPKY